MRPQVIVASCSILENHSQEHLITMPNSAYNVSAAQNPLTKRLRSQTIKHAARQEANPRTAKVISRLSDPEIADDLCESLSGKLFREENENEFPSIISIF